MFSLRTLEMVNWDFWQRFTLPLDSQIITVTGPNGSGKTTLLDALRTLLAISCSGKRDYKRYVRRNGMPFAWLRTVVDNRRIGNRRHPFFPLLEDEVTLACRIRKQGGEWLRQYAIAPGDTPIETLEETSDWLGVGDYRRRLESAGLTPAITKVLALEQGDTDKLCEYSPKALLDLVFDVFGDKEVLDRYLEAKAEQREAERELRDMELRLSTLQNQVEALVGRANRHLEWKALNDERQALVAEILPRLELAELRESIAGGSNQRAGARRQLRQKEAALAALEARRRALDGQLEAARAAETAAAEGYRHSQESFRAAAGEAQRLEHLLEERRRLDELAQARDGADAAASAAELARGRRELAALQHERDAAERRLGEIGALLAALNSGTIPPDEQVRAFRAALEASGIGHRMLNEVIEVTDPGWQATLEALLHPYRHVVLLEREQDRTAAWALGEKLRYRHFVVAELRPAPAAEPGTLLEVVRLLAPAPEWLTRLLNRVARVEDAAAGTALAPGQDWITRDGFHRERRGGRFIGIAPAAYRFGEAARAQRLQAAAEEERQLRAQLAELTRREDALQQAVSRHEALLSGLDAAQLLAARHAEFAQAERHLPQAAGRAQQLADAVVAADRARAQATEARHGVQTAIARLETQLAQLRRELDGERQALAQQREDQVGRILAFRRRRSTMPPRWRGAEGLRALAERYGKAVDARRELERVERRLAAEDWETDPAVLDLRDKLREDAQGLEREVAVRRGHFERAGALAHDARGAYINVLRATVRQYGRNLRALGQLAGIGVQAEHSPLENDDLVLAQAGLTVSFNFDDKGFIGLDDGEASGGQQVMKSLILLIGLLMTEDRPGGCVFIDEPFAHLDIFNIDRVSAFLKATQTQYLITSPNTHNVNVFSPSGLTLVTRKKQPGESWAQPVAFIRRQA